MSNVFLEISVRQIQKIKLITSNLPPKLSNYTIISLHVNFSTSLSGRYFKWYGSQDINMKCEHVMTPIVKDHISGLQKCKLTYPGNWTASSVQTFYFPENFMTITCEINEIPISLSCSVLSADQMFAY